MGLRTVKLLSCKPNRPDFWFTFRLLCLYIWVSRLTRENLREMVERNVCKRFISCSANSQKLGLIDSPHSVSTNAFNPIKSVLLVQSTEVPSHKISLTKIERSLYFCKLCRHSYYLSKEAFVHPVDKWLRKTTDSVSREICKR